MDDECFYVERIGICGNQRLLDKINYIGEMMWDESLLWIDSQGINWTQMIANDDKIYLFYCLQTGNDYRYLVTFKGFDADGQLLEGIPDEGLIICYDYCGQWLSAAESPEENNFIVLWKDYRSLGPNSSNHNH